MDKEFHLCYACAYEPLVLLSNSNGRFNTIQKIADVFI